MQRKQIKAQMEKEITNCTFYPGHITMKEIQTLTAVWGGDAVVSVGV